MVLIHRERARRANDPPGPKKRTLHASKRYIRFLEPWVRENTTGNRAEFARMNH